MATATVLNTELRLLPIADANLASLEKLFDEECEEWLALLKWDYKGASMLIRDVARQRQLSGFVAMSGELTVGFGYYLVETPRCSVGDLYVSKRWRGMGVDRELAAAILDKAERIARIRRIESQCVGIANYEADLLFQTRGFQRFQRNYMLADVVERQSVEAAPLDITVRPWNDSDFSNAVKAIHRSYRDTHDSRINSQYRTERGCADLLTVLTEHLWCGDFLPAVSQVACHPSGAMAGVLIASRVASGVGHIAQISVHPAHQGRGIGRRMIERALAEYRNRGYKHATLAVTSANTNALRLYENCGFRTIHTFPVFYREGH